MKTFKLKFIAFLAMLGTIAACSVDSGDNSCFFSSEMATTEVTGPETTTVDVPITLNVSFIVASECGTFNRFLESTDQPKRVVAYVDYSGCNCEIDPHVETKPYVFTASAAGTYQLTFPMENNLSITKTITVTE